MLTQDMTLWPPTPDPESWSSDTPNEGLHFGIEEEPEFYDTFADYNGLFIVDPEDFNNLMFIRVNLTPTQNQEYLAAYQIILEEFACCWNNPLPPEANWSEIAGKIVERLKEAGWREIEEEIEKPNIYWRWKPC